MSIKGRAAFNFGPSPILKGFGDLGFRALGLGFEGLGSSYITVQKMVLYRFIFGFKGLGPRVCAVWAIGVWGLRFHGSRFLALEFPVVGVEFRGLGCRPFVVLRCLRIIELRVWGSGFRKGAGRACFWGDLLYIKPWN